MPDKLLLRLVNSWPVTRAPGVAVLTFLLVLAALVSAAMTPDLDELTRFRIGPAQVSSGPTDAGRTQTTRVRLPDHSGEEQALFVPQYGGAAAALDADEHDLQRLQAPGNWGTDRYRDMGLWRIPMTLPAGDKRTVVLVRTEDRLPAGLGEIYAGPLSILQPVHDRISIALKNSKGVFKAAVAISFIAAFGLIYFSSRPMRYVYIFLFLAAIPLVGIAKLQFDPVDRLRSLEGYYLSLHLGLLALALAEWFDRSATEKRRIVMGLACSWAVLAIGDFLVLQFGPSLRVAVLGIVCAALLSYWLTLASFSYRAGGAVQRIVFALFSLFLLALGSYVVLLFTDLAFELRVSMVQFARVLGSLALVGLVAVALQYEYRLFRDRREQVDALERIVSGANLDTDLAARSLRGEIESKALEEERSRLTRDLHDGLSGQLLSLLLKARSGSITPGEVERELEDSLADLRLISTAMDSAGRDLGQAFEAFRLRVETQAANAGMALVWNSPAAGFSGSLDQRQLLSLLRVIQEAVTNALRHSDARVIELSIGEQDGRLTVVVGDDGKGLPPNSTGHGTGLRNMIQRCEQLGGRLLFGPNTGGKGARFDIAIPLSSPG